jgi:xylulokinase
MGGGARSDAWMQLKSDIVGLPIERTLVTEAGCLGAAFLAGLGIGKYSTPDDITALVSVDRVFEPTPAASRSYEGPYATYLEIRERIKGLDLE